MHRLHAALAAAQVHLAATPLRLVITDDLVAYLTRPGGVSTETMTRLQNYERARKPLSHHEAFEVMQLLHDSLLEPFPDERSVRRVARPDINANFITTGLALPDDAAVPPTRTGPTSALGHGPPRPDVRAAPQQHLRRRIRGAAADRRSTRRPGRAAGRQCLGDRPT